MGAAGTRWRRLLVIAVYAMIGLSLSYSVYYLFRYHATENLVSRFDYGEAEFENGLEDVRREWRPRIGSILLVRLFHTPHDGVMGHRLSIWFGAWFGVIALLYVGLDRRAAPFLALGTFAAISYAHSPITGNVWYPWDMPALLLATLALLFALRRNRWALAAVVVLAVPFKETVLVMGLLLLFFEGPSLRSRIAFTAAVIAAGIGLRLVIAAIVGTPVGPDAFSYRVFDDPSRVTRFALNLSYVFSAKANSFWWANVGTIALLFVLPVKDRVLRGMRLVGAVFLGALLFAGTYNELRVFLELLPASLLIVWRFLDEQRTPATRAT